MATTSRRPASPGVLCALVMVSLVWGVDAGAHPALNLGDLEQLSKKEQYEEALSRAREIAPRERNTRWEALVAQGALALLLDDTQRDPLAAYEKALDRERAFPHLRRDTPYRSAYEKMVIKSMTVCFNAVAARQNRGGSNSSLRADACLRRGERLRTSAGTSVKTLAASSTTLWRGGDRIGAVLNMGEAFTRADADSRRRLCLVDQTQSVVDFGFTQAVKSDAAGFARKIVFEHCGEILTEELQNELAKSPSLNVYKNACPTLLKRKALKGLAKKRCASKL